MSYWQDDTEMQAEFFDGLNASEKQQTTIVRNKGELMRLVYSEKELRNVDSAIPMSLWGDIDTAIHVYDYNTNSFGDLVNLERLAEKKSIKFKWAHL
jgi:hypothetical protein